MSLAAGGGVSEPVVGVLALAVVIALYTFGPRRGGRPAGPGSRLFGVILLSLLAFGGCVGVVWRYFLVGCPMGGCA